MIFFDIATSWHKVYALYVESVLSFSAFSNQTTDVQYDEQSCYLGHWISGIGNRYSSTPEFQELLASHAKFHSIAEAAIQHANGKGVSAVWLEHTVGTLRKASSAVIEAIAKLNAIASGYGARDIGAEIPCPISQYRVGVAVIDEQHQALSTLAQHLLESPSECFTDDENVELLAELVALTNLHFKTEEIYMRSIQLPPLEQQRHEAEHQGILGKLSALKENAKDMAHLKTSDVVPYFAKWFKDHLIDYDYSLKRY